MGSRRDPGLVDDHVPGAAESPVGVRHAFPAKEVGPGGPSLTKASLGVGLETREIVAKYIETGILEAWNRAQPRFGDFSGPLDLQSALDRVLEAQESFQALPPEVRDRCQNDPVEFLRLVNDPAGAAELRGFGLVLPGDQVVQPGASPQGEKSPQEKTSPSGASNPLPSS